MPNIQLEELENNVIKLSIKVPHDEVMPYLEEAALHLSQESSIPGFRPGKAGYEIVKQRLGEMKIYEEALETIVRKTFVEAVLANDIESVGAPKIDVEKLAPGNDIVYTAEVSLMPKIKVLADFASLSVKAKKVTAEEKDVDLALKDIQRMQTKEVRAKSGVVVSEKDKVVISTNMKKAGVPVEGGQSPNHAIYLTEDYYIPGFKEEILGMREGDQKTFTLKFPKEHVQKMLAGEDIEFEIELKEIYHLEPPELDDAFATSLGIKDLKELKDKLHENILLEEEKEEMFRQEKEMLELLATKTQIENIPDLLVNEELEKMIQELKRGVEEQGADFEEYLKNIKKTYSELKLDFTPQAINRIKIALIMREIAKQEKITVEDKELDEELDKAALRYEDEDAKKQIYSPQYRDYMEQMIRNRKVISMLKEKMVK